MQSVYSTAPTDNVDADQAYGEKAWRQLLKNAASYIEQVLEAASHKAAAVRPPTTHIKNHPNKTNKTCGTLLKK